jgi:hypothetical protein
MHADAESKRKKAEPNNNQSGFYSNWKKNAVVRHQAHYNRIVGIAIR